MLYDCTNSDAAGRYSHRRFALPALAVAAFGFVGVYGAASAQAANQAFDNFLLQSCAAGATGAFATRCAQAPAGLSGDSESSLNPSQSLSNNELSISRAKALSKESQSRLEEGREKQAGRSVGRAAGETAELGPISMFLNVDHEIFDFNRILDLDREKGYDGWKSGFQIGGDMPLSDRLIVGALIGIDHSEAQLDRDLSGRNFIPFDSEGGNRSTGAFLNVYSSYSVTDNMYVEGTLGYGYSSYTFDRNAVFQETTRVTPQTNVSTSGDTHGNSINASIGAGYDIYSGALSIGPYVRLNFSRSKIEGYTEEDRSNSGLNMNVGDDTATSLTSVLGMQMSYAHSADWGVFVPQLRFEYEHEHRDDARAITTSFVADATGSSFTVLTDDPDKNYFNVGASLLFILPNGWMPFVDAELLMSYKDLDRQRFTFGLRKEL